jgi:hypothetical protein
MRTAKKADKLLTVLKKNYSTLPPLCRRLSPTEPHINGLKLYISTPQKTKNLPCPLPKEKTDGAVSEKPPAAASPPMCVELPRCRSRGFVIRASPPMCVELPRCRSRGFVIRASPPMCVELRRSVSLRRTGHCPQDNNINRRVYFPFNL